MRSLERVNIRTYVRTYSHTYVRDRPYIPSTTLLCEGIISFLAQRVHVSEILRHFSQLYPTHSRLVYDPTGTIVAILHGEVPHMLPAKYIHVIPPGSSGRLPEMELTSRAPGKDAKPPGS